MVRFSQAVECRQKLYSPKIGLTAMTTLSVANCYCLHFILAAILRQTTLLVETYPNASQLIYDLRQSK